MAHRPTLKKRQKAFKSRHGSKGAIKDSAKGRVEKAESANGKKHVMSKLERRNLKNQVKAGKQTARAEQSKIFDGRNGVPRNVAIIPLTADISSVDVAQRLAASLDAAQEGRGVINVGKFRQRLRLFVPEFANFFDVLDAARGADFVLFVLSANTEIDDYGEQIVRCIAAQGVSTCLGLIWGLAGSKRDVKEQDVRTSLTSWFSHFFTGERLYSLDSDAEVSVAGRQVCQKMPRGIHWRDERAYVVAEHATVVGANMVVQGYVRGRDLSPLQFMHLHGYGDFRISRMHLADESQAWEPSVARPLTALVPEADAVALHAAEDVAEDSAVPQGVRLDGHTDVTAIIEANAEDSGPQQARHVPKGTSDYQAAWFVEGEDYGSDADGDADGDADADVDGDAVLTDEEGDLVDGARASDDESDGMDDDMDGMDDDDDDDDDDDEAEARRNMTPEERRAREAQDDLEFPDEVELDPKGSGKERLRRYRGVRNIRSAEWDALEADPRAPAEFARLFRPGNLVAERNRVSKHLDAGATVGSRVVIYLEGAAPADAKDPAPLIERGAALIGFSLLPGEEKLGYVSTTIGLDSEVSSPVKSKEQVIVQYGPRRLLVQPLFSQGGHADSAVSKYSRFLHPGRGAVATFIAPVLLGNAPVVYYNLNTESPLRIVGSGTVQDSDADRVIVKAAILTGVPVKIHRKLVTVRHMFYSRADVEWFKAVPLYTKLGAHGFIKESLGTHGLFKATFDKKIRSEDTIALPLYKREWPRIAAPAPI